MISKLPRWFWCGTWILACIAGVINVIGLLGFSHQTVSHLTGNTSMLAAAIATGDVSAALHFGLVIGSFLVGTVLSGFIIQDSALQLGHRYGVTMLLESFCLCLAVPLLKHESLYGIYCLACACGLQKCNGQHLQWNRCPHHACFRNVYRPRHFPGACSARLAD